MTKLFESIRLNCNLFLIILCCSNSKDIHSFCLNILLYFLGSIALYPVFMSAIPDDNKKIKMKDVVKVENINNKIMVIGFFYLIFFYFFCIALKVDRTSLIGSCSLVVFFILQKDCFVNFLIPVYGFTFYKVTEESRTYIIACRSLRIINRDIAINKWSKVNGVFYISK